MEMATVVVLVLVAVLVIVFRPEPIQYDPATPEGRVQTYVRAVIDRDNDAAAALMVDEPDCETDPYPRFGDESSCASQCAVQDVLHVRCNSNCPRSGR